MPNYPIYHAMYQGVPGFARASDRYQPCWLFIPVGQNTVYDVAREQLVLLGEVERAAVQKAEDGNLAAKVCGY